jgi:formate hydrogenlyase subunit 3/multisubunit Na+/H+ antiporter MnhD subunit
LDKSHTQCHWYEHVAVGQPPFHYQTKCAGYWSLYKVSSIENGLGLNDFHGHIYEHPKYGLLFLLCALTMIGFPISPTFLGYDILFADIEENHLLLLIISGFTFIFLEIAIVRIYARVFLGQHIKNYHEVAFRSS